MIKSPDYFGLFLYSVLECLCALKANQNKTKSDILNYRQKKAYHGLTGKDYTQQYLYSEGLIVMNNNTV